MLFGRIDSLRKLILHHAGEIQAKPIDPRLKIGKRKLREFVNALAKTSLPKKPPCVRQQKILQSACIGLLPFRQVVRCKAVWHHLSEFVPIPRNAVKPVLDADGKPKRHLKHPGV